MTELDAAMFKQMEYIGLEENRAFCVLDFRHFEIDGKEYRMAGGTFRNKISKFRKEGRVVFQFLSGNAYYSIPGYKFTKEMTQTHVGVPLNIGRQTPIYKWIKNRPLEKQSLHDIRLTFIAKGLWNALLNLYPNQVNASNKDIKLDAILFQNGIQVHITAHHSDTISIAIACSFRPIVIGIPDILYLIEILTRTETTISGYCNNAGFQNIIVPRYTTWIAKLWHFGYDTLDRYDGPEFHITFEEGISDLWRIYTKRMKRENGVRIEHQECPNIPVIDAVMDKLYQDGQII